MTEYAELIKALRENDRKSGWQDIDHYMDKAADALESLTAEAKAKDEQLAAILYQVDCMDFKDQQIDTLTAENERLKETERWIAVSERLPNKGKCDDWHTHVLVLAGERVLEAYLNPWGTWSRANSAPMRDLPPVTHWKPLPSVPKGV